MTQQTIDLHVNPSEENIRVGPLMVRFLLTGDNSTGSIAAFELTVPGPQRLPVPAHSHDHYEGEDLRYRRRVDLDCRQKTTRCRNGAGTLHSTGRHSPVR